MLHHQVDAPPRGLPTDRANDDTAIGGADSHKTFATLQARLALAGWALTHTDVGDGSATYFASRWNLARDLDSLEAVAQFADRVGAPV